MRCYAERVARCLPLAFRDGMGELLLGSIVLTRVDMPILLINTRDMTHILHIK